LFQIVGSRPGIYFIKTMSKDNRVVMFISFAFTPTDQNYYTGEREALAVLKSLEQCRWLVCGSKCPVKIYTDYMALGKLLKSGDGHDRITRWQFRFGEYWPEVHHVPGKDLTIADGRSRVRPEYTYRPTFDREEKSALPPLVKEEQEGGLQYPIDMTCELVEAQARCASIISRNRRRERPVAPTRNTA